MVEPVLAHQGGWDEILLVGTPIALFAFLLWVANRRARAQMEARERDRAADHAERAETPEPAPDDEPNRPEPRA